MFPNLYYGYYFFHHSYPGEFVEIFNLFMKFMKLKFQIICMTNFDGDERIRIKQMINAIGARYTGHMTHGNSALICRRWVKNNLLQFNGNNSWYTTDKCQVYMECIWLNYGLKLAWKLLLIKIFVRITAF